MKKLLPGAFVFFTFLVSCQGSGDTSSNPSGKVEQPAVTLCEFSTTDSATAVTWLKGKWELRGLQTNYMGAQKDVFLTREQVGDAKTLTFFENGEYEEHVNGKLQGERQPYNLVGQSLTPVGYQFWFCDENTLVINNVVADGATEVFVRQQ